MKDEHDKSNSQTGKSEGASASSAMLSFEECRCLPSSYPAMIRADSDTARIKIINSCIETVNERIQDATNISAVLTSQNEILNREQTEEHYHAQLLAAELNISFVELSMNKFDISSPVLATMCSTLRDVLNSKFPHYIQTDFVREIREMNELYNSWKNPEEELSKLESEAIFEIQYTGKKTSHQKKSKSDRPKLTAEEFEEQKKRADAMCAELLKEEDAKQQKQVKKIKKAAAKKRKAEALEFIKQQEELVENDKATVRENLEKYYKDGLINKTSPPMPKEIIATYIKASLPLFSKNEDLDKFISCGAWLVTFLNQSKGWEKDHNCIQLVKQFLFCLNALDLKPEIIPKNYPLNIFKDIIHNVSHQKNLVISLLKNRALLKLK